MVQGARMRMRMLYVRYYMTPTPKQESEVWAKVVTAKGGADRQKSAYSDAAWRTRGGDAMMGRNSRGNNPVHVEKQVARRLAAQGRIVGCGER